VVGVAYVFGASGEYEHRVVLNDKGIADEDPTVSSTGDRADALSGLKCADLIDAMGRVHRHRCHVLDLVSPTPGRVLFGPAAAGHPASMTFGPPGAQLCGAAPITRQRN